MRTTGLLLLLTVLLGMGAPASAQLAQSPNTEWDDVDAPRRSADRASRDRASRSLRRTSPPADTALAHVVEQRTFLYNRSDSTAPVKPLPVRTPLHRLDCTDAWCRVRTKEGRAGYVPSAAVSSVWIRISKADRRLFLYRGLHLIGTFPIDVGYNTFADKKRRGSREDRDHWRTPEGTFYVVGKNSQSEFYKALILNYPTIADAERGLANGLISRGQYETIVRAQKQRRMPPMGTKLGGWIEIHGEGTGGETNWTQGCVAVQNQVMNDLWVDVDVGTPVLIE